LSLRRFWETMKNSQVLGVPLIECLLTFLSAALLFRGVLEGFVFIGDMHFPVYPERLLNATNYAVYDRFNLGVNNIFGWVVRSPFVTLFFVFYKITFNSVSLAQFFYFTILFWIGGISVYLAISSLSLGLNRVVKFIASLFYMVNPWICNRLASGHILVITAYAFVPLAFWSFLKLLDTVRTQKHVANKIFYIVITSLVITVISTSLHVLIITIIILFLYLIFIFIDIASSKDYQHFISISKALFFLTTLSFLLNAYWFLPLVFGGDPPLKYPSVDAFIFYSKNATLLNTLRVDVYWFSLFHNESLVFWLVISLLIPLFAFIAPLVNRRKIVWWFLILALVGIFLSLGGNNPFNIWLFNNLSFFSAFQDPDKFSLITLFSFAFLISISLGHFFERIRKSKQTIVASALILLILCNSYIQINNVGGLLVGANIPKEYYEVNDLFVGEDCRVLWLPLSWNLKYRWTTTEVNGYTDQYSKLPVIDDPIGPDIPTKTRDIITYVYSNLALNRTIHFGGMASLLGIKYVVFRGDLEETSNAPYLSCGRYIYKNLLNNLHRQSDLDFLAEKGALTIFENKKTSDIIFATSDAILIAGGRKELLALLTSAPTEYEIANHAIFFLDDINPQNLNDLAPHMNILLLGDVYDLLAYLEKEKRIECSFFASEKNVEEGWTEYSVWAYSPPGNYWFPEGEFVFGNLISSSKADSILNVPFNITNDGEYEIYLRVGCSTISGEISVFLNDSKVNSFNARSLNVQDSSYIDFKWIGVYSGILSTGAYTLKIKNDYGLNTVDEVLIIDKEEKNNAFENIKSFCSNKNVLFVEELSKAFDIIIGEYSLKQTIEAFNGRYLLVTNKTSFRSNLFFGKDASYIFEINCPFESYFSGKIEIFVDDFAAYSEMLPYKLRKSIKSLPVILTSGFHEIRVEIECNSPVPIDLFLYYDAENVFKESGRVRMEFKKISPTKYEVYVDFSKPLFICFSQSYDSYWVLKSDNKEYAHFLGFGYMNIFLIDKFHNGVFYLEYIQQQILDAGKALSYFSFAFCIGWLILYKLKHKFRNIKKIWRRKKDN